MREITRNVQIGWIVLALWVPGATASTLGYASGSAAGASQYRQTDQHGGCSYGGLGTPSGGCSYEDWGTLEYPSSDGQQWVGVQDAYSAAMASSVDTNGLHAMAAVSITNDPVDPAMGHYWASDPGSATAQAIWQDTIQINGSGMGAALAIALQLDGIRSASTTHARADAKVEGYAQNQTTYASSSQTWTYSTLAQQGPPLPVSPFSTPGLAVSPGDKVFIWMRLTAYATVGCQALTSAMLCTAGASSNLGNNFR